MRLCETECPDRQACFPSLPFPLPLCVLRYPHLSTFCVTRKYALPGLFVLAKYISDEGGAAG
jgi:hypothetical protein